MPVLEYVECCGDMLNEDFDEVDKIFNNQNKR